MSKEQYKSKERVACITGGCNNCSKAVLVGETFLRKKPLYSCSERERKHKRVNARECKQFRCNTPQKWNFCSDCRKGK